MSPSATCKITTISLSFSVSVTTTSSGEQSDVEGGKSLAYTLAIMTGSTVTGFKGQSTYSEMNKGQGFMAKWNRWLNGFNSNGSVTLPKAGTGARKKIFVHK